MFLIVFINVKFVKFFEVIYNMKDVCETLQDVFLNAVRENQENLSVYLINGIKLQGCLVDFDHYCIKLKNANGVEQLIYKSAVSTLSPIRQ